MIETELWILSQFPVLSYFTYPEFLEWRRGQVPLRKDTSKLPKLYTLFLPALPKGTNGLLQGNCTGEKKIIKTFVDYKTLVLKEH